MENESYEVLQVQQDQNVIQVDAIERANVDSQVATAKQYPRDVRRCVDNSIVMATIDKKTAQSCGYALPRGGKMLTGPSVHLAKLIVRNWGNIRAEAKVVQITDKQVVSRGTCWDLENNVATAFEVRRSIVGKTGHRFSDDMITVTGNAANAIAYRNAVFSVIPKSVVDKVYESTQRYIIGDISDDDKLITRRKNSIDFFKNEYGISEEEVVKLCGKQTVNQIKTEQIALLIGITQAITDGDTTVDELMAPFRKKEKINSIAEIAAEAAETEETKKKEKK